MIFDDVRAKEIVIKDCHVLYLDKNIFPTDTQIVRQNISVFTFVWTER